MEAHQISPLKAGDGVMFDAATWRSPQEAEEGGRLFEVIAKPTGNLELLFGNDAVKFGRIRTGDLVWRTSDPEIDRVVRPYLEAGLRFTSRQYMWKCAREPEKSCA